MAIRKAKRISDLERTLSKRRVIHLREAAQVLGVSEMTVRRDIAGHTDQFAYLGGHIMLAADIETDRPYELATAADSHAAAKREAEELVPEADAEQGRLTLQLADGVYGVGERLGITWTIGEEDTIRIHTQDVGGRGRGGNDSHAAVLAGQHAQDV